MSSAATKSEEASKAPESAEQAAKRIAGVIELGRRNLVGRAGPHGVYMAPSDGQLRIIMNGMVSREEAAQLANILQDYLAKTASTTIVDDEVKPDAC